jgi:dephospho-CoA kinase
MGIAGLTGGIATGKSTVSSIFDQLGASVIDADKISHQALARDGAAFAAVIEVFGEGILDANGGIDRKALGAVVFKDPLAKKRLNQIVHPIVFAVIEHRIHQLRKQSSKRVIILDIPLLIETGRHTSCEEVIVVYVPEALQLQRLMQRDGIEEAQAWQRIRSQMPIDEKRRHATLIIDNSGPMSDTTRQVKQAFEYLLTKGSH